MPNDNKAIDELIKEICGLERGEVTNIALSDKPRYDALHNVFPPLCYTYPYYANGKGPCKYSVPVNGEIFYFEVKEYNDTVSLKRVEKKRLIDSSYFNSFLEMNS